MRLFLVETARHARRLRSLGFDAPAGDRALALLPEGARELERRGIPHDTDADLVSDEPFQRVAATTIDPARRLSEGLDELAGAERPAWRLLDVEIKRLLTSVLGRAALLRGMLEDIGAREVIFFDSGTAPPSPTLDFGGSPWAPVLAALLPQLGLRGGAVADRSARAAYRPHGLRLKQRLDIAPRRYAALVRARRRFRAFDRPRPETPPVLLVSAFGPVLDAARRTAAAGHPVVQWSGRGRPRVLFGSPRLAPPAPTKASPAAAEPLRGAVRRGRHAVAEAARLDGLDLSAPVLERLGTCAARWGGEIAATSESAVGTLERLAPVLLLTAYSRDWWERAVRRAAHGLAVPVIGFQHGGGNGYLREDATAYRALMDLAAVDTYVAWGPGVAEGYCSADPPARVVIQPPPAVAELRARRGSSGHGGRRLLFLPTNMGGHLRQGPGSDLPDTVMAELSRRVVEAALAVEGVTLTVKQPVPSYARDPLGERFRSEQRVTITQRGWVPEMLGVHDGVIVGWPFTALLEAIATDLPVLCIADQRSVPLRAEALEMLRRRAIVVTALDGIAPAVAKLTSAAAKGPLAAPDDGFLERYGLGEPAGDWWPPSAAS